MITVKKLHEISKNFILIKLTGIAYNTESYSTIKQTYLKLASFLSSE